MRRPTLWCLAILVVVVLSDARAGTWESVTSQISSRGGGSAMAYDAARGRLVLFGGFDGEYLGDTWEWDGRAWTLRASTGPSPRRWHAMAYDAGRGRVVLFGGYDHVPLWDTWEWDGNTWTQRASSGPPPPRYLHAMAYDAARGRVVLHGGKSGSSYDLTDTWEWNGTTWTLRTASGPAARFAHAMAYDAGRGRVVLFGGRQTGGGSAVLGDTWEWDGDTWTLKGSSGPARSDHAMTYDAAPGRVLLFGGRGAGSSVLADTWEWNGSTWDLRTSVGPPGRVGHAVALDAARARVVLFGGEDGAGSNRDDTWEWDGTTWTSLSTSGPPRRMSDAMAYDAARGRAVLFGGRLAVGTYLPLGDTWEWDGGRWIRSASFGPSPRDRHAMAYDAARGRVVLFGGREQVSSSFRNDTWEWDGTAWTQRATAGPSSRVGHAMAYDAARGRVVLFGGINSSNTSFGDTWEWDGANWSLRTSSGPSTRYDHRMAYDSTRERVVLFGGFGQDHLGDTWEWDGATWTQRASSGPAQRNLHAMAHDAARGRVVLFGGYNGTTLEYLGDTWEWDGAAWTLGASTGPSKATHAMVYDAARGRIVVFGGSSLGDTWEYSGCEFVEQRVYGRLLFPPLCTKGASALAQDRYGRADLGLFHGARDTFFLSSEGDHFSPLVVDDEVRLNGADTGLGPYGYQPGVPPVTLGVPIEENLVPLPAQDVTGLVPGGAGTVSFQLLDTDRSIYGNTAVYLVRDCGVWLRGSASTEIHWVTHHDQVGGTPPEFDIRSGLLSHLRADRDFSRASCLGHYTDTPALDALPGPSAGDGRYYLVRGLSSCQVDGHGWYGDSSLEPDPRDALDTLPTCP